MAEQPIELEAVQTIVVQVAEEKAAPPSTRVSVNLMPFGSWKMEQVIRSTPSAVRTEISARIFDPDTKADHLISSPASYVLAR